MLSLGFGGFYSGCSPVGLRRGIWDAEIQCSNHCTPTMICENCGKEHDGYYGSGRFCCASCRASFTNKQRGKHSEETKQKITKSINNKLLSGTYHPNNQYTNNSDVYIKTTVVELVDNKFITNPNNYKIQNKSVNKLHIVKHICPICNTEYYGYITKYGNISFSFCSEICAKQSAKSILSDKVKKRIIEGTFSGWKSRNIISYPEKFWIKVLNNNHIDFIKEYHLDNKYFLDFYIEKNGIYIDLEIDGKQHKYEDRLIHDKIRDEYVSSKNILVYRIDWNEIKSIDGSLLMKEKIDNFLNWYNEL